MPAGAQAQNTSPHGRWQFTVAPYLLAPNMNGQVTVQGHSVDVDANPGDIFESLDMAFMLYLEVANRDWAVTLDGVYMNLGEEGETRRTGREAEVDLQQLAIQANGLRRVAPWAEIGIGVRVNSIEAGLRIAPGDQALPGTDVSDTKTWVDPLLVTRLSAPLESAWRLGLEGDVGGFGIGSDFAWQVYPSVGYRFGDLFELSGGYRALGMKYEAGRGDDLFIYDMVIFGPQLGFVFHF